MLQSLVFMFALVCFLVAAWQSASPHWNRLIAIGLAAFMLSFLVR